MSTDTTTTPSVPTATLPRVGRGAPTEEIVEHLERSGAVIIEGFLGPDVVDAVNREVDAAVAAADPAMALHSETLSAFHGATTRHVTGVAGKSRTFAIDVMAHPIFRALCDHYLAPADRTFVSSRTPWQLNLAHLIVRGPGAPAQPLHRDEDVWMEHPYPRQGELQVAAMLSFVDFTVENGATRVVPGSHRWPERQEPLLQRAGRVAEYEPLAVHAVMPAGSAVVYFGSTLHAASANTTDDVWRRAAHVSFTRGWLRTEENNYLAVPPEVARTLPRECQEILGYPVYGFLGTLDMLDPVELLADGRL